MLLFIQESGRIIPSYNSKTSFSKPSLFRSNAPMQLLNIILATDVLTTLKRGDSVNLMSDHYHLYHYEGS